MPRVVCSTPKNLSKDSVLNLLLERLRIGSDLMHALYVFDEYTDRESSAGVRDISAIILDALRNTDKPRPEGELVLGKIIREYAGHIYALRICADDCGVSDSFWARGRAITTPEAEKHFIEAMEVYLEGVAYQAEDQEKQAIRTIETYMETRRMDSGVRPCLSPCEFHLSIPDEAFYHPVVKELRDASIDLVVLDNVSSRPNVLSSCVLTSPLQDIASYNREQALGDASWNILSVVMNQFKLDLYHATEWAAQYHKVAKARFLNALTQLPSFGTEVDVAMQEYVAGIAAWPRGNNSWCFESERYFGTKGAQVRKVGKAPLLAKRVMDPEMRREKVEVQLIDKLEQVPSDAILFEGLRVDILELA